MRVTSESQSLAVLRNIQLNNARMAKLQEQITTGKRLQRPSDGPADTVLILQNKAASTRLDTHLNAIRDASSILQTSVDALTNARDLISRAKDIAIEVNSAAHDPATDGAFANELDVAIDQLMRIANQRLPDGRYLFGGSASSTPPFVVTSTDGAARPTTISYRGSDQDSQAIVDKGASVGVLISGSQVFQTRARSTTVYTGATGARAGTGTDSATGQGTLQVRHVLTTFAGSSGVAAGVSSAAGDTVIGAAGVHSLIINDTSGTGASGTISLNGGPAIAFTNTDSDLKVVGSSGETVYLNTTAIAPGFNGSVALSATGSLSTDGGATTIPIDFSGNQSITNSHTGAVTNVDSTAIVQAGSDRLDYQGTSDAFQTLISLRDDIRNSQGMSATDRTDAISRVIAELDRVSTGVIDAIGSQSVQSEYLTKLKERTADAQLNLQKDTDSVESVDMATALSDFQQQQNLYQISLQLAVQMNSMSLADFLH